MNDAWKRKTFDQKQDAVRAMEVERLQEIYGLSREEAERLKHEVETGPRRTEQPLKQESATPDKRSLREASRDFDLDLIFAELIDNSIDRFLKDQHHSGDELQIRIDFDSVLSRCVYEDNAGGFRQDTLINFFRPGGTENLPGTQSIGSYAWGAKKSRAALASSVDLLSRASGQPACLGSIKHRWDEDDHDWNILVGVEEEHFTLDDRSQIVDGHTRLTFKDLKPLILDHLQPFALDQLRKSLGEIYALILVGHHDAPGIKLDIRLQGEPVTGTYAYLWTVFNEESYDLRPHRYRFLTEVLVPFSGRDELQEHDLEVILEIGIKQGTGCATAGITESEHFNTTDDWGIDVYGNGRLIQRNVRGQLGITEEYLKDNASKLVKGRLILNGPSHAIPWDTHKTRLASIHPALPVINRAVGSFIIAYFQAARQAAGRGTDLEGAVNKFKAKPWNGPPWNGQWSIVTEDGTQVSLEYDDVQAATAPSPVTGAAPLGETPAGGDSLPADSVGGPDRTPEPSQLPPEQAMDSVPPSTAPVAGPPQTAPGGATASADPQRGAAIATVAPSRSGPITPPRPTVPPRQGRGSRRQKWIKFPVTEAERQDLLRWCSCPVKNLSDKIKEKVFAAKAAEEQVPIATTTPATPAEGIAGFRQLRDLINDPEVIAKLQRSNLSTINRVREAGQDGLLAAGLTELQIAAVLGKVAND